jgi:hypothetical protein
MLSANPPGARPVSPKEGDDDDVELITDYSWRNFFSVINFVHILQKLTKRKTHRVLLLVQYKSSVITILAANPGALTDLLVLRPSSNASLKSRIRVYNSTSSRSSRARSPTAVVNGDSVSLVLLLQRPTDSRIHTLQQT